MRDVRVQVTTIKFHATLLVCAMMACVMGVANAPQASALTLQLHPVKTLNSVVTSTTSDLKQVISPPKHMPSPQPIVPKPIVTFPPAPTPTPTPPPTSSTPPASSSPSSPPKESSPSSSTHHTAAPSESSSNTVASTTAQPALERYQKVSADSRLMQPFTLSTASTPFPYLGALTLSHPYTVKSLFIEATPQGWKIGGILWYWWLGLLVFGVLTGWRLRAVHHRQFKVGT